MSAVESETATTPTPSEETARGKRSHWVGFDLGGTKMLCTVYDEKFRARGRKRRRTKGHEGSEAGLDRIIGTIERALDDAKLGPEDIQGIGIGCPGPLDLKKGTILEAPNLGWTDAPVASRLEKHFGCPAVILNDVDAGVYGEYRFGAAKDARCVVGIFPGTGVGGGCVYEGKIIQGRRSSCLEVGHMEVKPHGPLCGCGQRGCLEAVASRLAVSAAAAQAAYRGQAPHLRQLAGTDLSDIKSGVLAESIAEGDKVIETIVRQAAAYIGTAVAGLVNLLAPDIVILGGGMVEAMPEIYVDTVTEFANAKVLPSFRGNFKVMASKLADDASVIGAAAWIQHVLQP